VFNLQGSELIIILLLALVVLGPEKLPEAMRKLGQFYAELKKMSHGFQQEFRNATDEPMREIRETANALRDSVDFRKFSSGEREEKPKSAEMAAVMPTVAATSPTTHTTVAPADPEAVPTDDVPTEAPSGDAAFAPPAAGTRAAESDEIGPPTAIESVVVDPVEVAPVPAGPVDIAPETLPPEGQVDAT
jgi:sec-independent protein translocase protein TatB